MGRVALTDQILLLRRVYTPVDDDFDSIPTERKARNII